MLLLATPGVFPLIAKSPKQDIGNMTLAGQAANRAGAAKMNIQMMNEAIRISDRFNGRDNFDSIDRQGRLMSVTALVIILHAITGVALVKMEEYHATRSRHVVPVDIAFEKEMVAKLLSPVSAPVPQPAALSDGHTDSPGGASASVRAASSKATLPQPRANEVSDFVAPKAASAKLLERKVDLAPITAVRKQSEQLIQKISKAPSEGNETGALSTLPASGAPIDSGETKGIVDGSSDGKTGNGAGGTGPGLSNIGDGSDDGLAGGVVPLALQNRTEAGPARRDIAPYKNALVEKLARNWKARSGANPLTVTILLGRDGELIDCQILRSSGDKKVDKSALKAVEATTFDPLPDWFKGDSLLFRIEMETR